MSRKIKVDFSQEEKFGSEINVRDLLSYLKQKGQANRPINGKVDLCIFQFRWNETNKK